MSNHIVGLKNYFRHKANLYTYYLNTKEINKTLAAFEELDSIIDFIDVHLELRDYGKVKTHKYAYLRNDNEKGMFQLLENQRQNLLAKFLLAAKKIINLLESEKNIDPTISFYKHQTLEYLNFKTTVNKLTLKEKSNTLNYLVTQFNRVYELLAKENLNTQYDDAINEITNLGIKSNQLKEDWMNTLTFSDRTILESQGLFRIEQEKRHIVFSKLFTRLKHHGGNLLNSVDMKQNSVESDRTQTTKNKLNKSNMQSRLHHYFYKIKKTCNEFLTPYNVENNVSNVTSETVFLTQKLDKYLYARDLRMNLTRKWARFIPLDMNHYLIKFYNDPNYWNRNHCYLDELDLLRLGFSYYQYSMELGTGSESFAMIYKKALVCFRKAKIKIPEELAKNFALV